MRKATRLTTAMLGGYAGLLGIEHGIFDTLQGNVAPAGVMIQAIGSPCQPEMVWHACFPAMTFIPSYLISGMIAIIIGTALLVWSLFFVQRERGGMVLILLSLVLLLVGGGFVPMFIGVAAGVSGSRMHASQRTPVEGGKLQRLAAKIWPWPLVLLVVWFPGSWIAGYYFGRLMLAVSGFLFLCFDVALPVLAVISSWARD